MPVYVERAAGDGGLRSSSDRHRGDAGGIARVTPGLSGQRRQPTASAKRRLRLRRGAAAEAAADRRMARNGRNHFSVAEFAHLGSERRQVDFS